MESIPVIYVNVLPTRAWSRSGIKVRCSQPFLSLYIGSLAYLLLNYVFILLFFNTKYKTFSFLRLINDFFKRKTRLVTQPQFNVYRVYYASYVAYTFICISLKHRMLLFVDILSTKFVMVPATDGTIPSASAYYHKRSEQNR